MEKTEEEEEQKSSSLFPLQAASAASLASSSNVPQWLCNTSFNTDLSVVNDAVSSLYNLTAAQSEDDEPRQQQATPKPSSYDLLQSSESDDGGRDSKREAKKHKKRKRRRYSEEEASAANDYASRKSGVGAWATRGSKPSVKDYYFDSRGDRDNLAFGCLYRMDVARYKLGNSAKLFQPGFQALYWWNKMGSILDRDGDLDVLDSKLKTGGRYWSAKHSVLERHKNLKRIRIVAHEKSKIVIPGDFIPLSEIQTSPVDVIDGSSLGTSTSEESWEDEVLRKTREFNKMSREHPHDEKIWLSFADFQDRIASMQPQKGARLQTLEKKISILEKATELNPENEELLLCLMKAYQSRDSTDVFIGRWEKILLQHSGSYMLWKEFLHVVQGEFSRFKVSDMRKLYVHAIQALSAACSKQYRQVHQTAKSPTSDPAVIELELGLVDIFLSLCRFEWQAGYQELATALFQAEIEYGLLCPCLFLSEQSKQRLFEHFWNGDGARVGEEGALGWSTWLEKEEENRQQVMKEETADENDKGGWTGWSEPLSKQKEINLEKTSINLENVADNDVDVDVEDLEDKLETKDTEQEEDTEALMKMLGIDVNAEANNEVKDTSIWTRWSEEESSRDCNQWMPFHTKSVGPSHMDESPDKQLDEQLLGVILFEDVSEYLFSLSSGEARISLLFHFIDFFGGKIPEWMCTNNSSWTEKILSLEAVPDFLSEKLRRVNDVLTKTQTSSCGFSLEVLLGNAHDASRRIDMMKFLRNAILLCLTAFPRNHILEEAVLVAEDMFLTKMNSCSCSVTPCRGLAKGLLKNDRQIFELALDGRKGRSQIRIVEKKRGVSTWIRLGLESLGLFKKGLLHCIRDENEGRWETEWRDRGKRFTLVRGSNRAGGFLRLGAADQERKTFYIFLPRGRRDKRGWLAMAEMIRQMEELVGRRMEPQEVWAGGKPSTEKSYAEAVLGSNRKVTSVIKLKVSREEMDENLQKLQQCLVASWKPSTKEDEDLERLGNLWAYSWGLKGRLGLAKLERGRALLEFEDKREAYRVASSGSRELGGVSLGLDFWKPQTGCWAEEERAQDVWVRIFGLPVSLWSPAILKKIGEECGGFVEIDERTRLMEEIQWARIRVKITGETRPSMLEIEVEEEFYSLVLWWEIRPVVRRLLSAVEIRRRTEDRGDALSRAEKRVGSVLLDTGIEGQFLPVDGRLLQENGLGLESRSQTHGSRSREWACVDGVLNGPPSHGSSLGLTEQEKGGGLAKRDGSLGRKLKNKLKMAVVPEAGPSSTCWASGMGCLSSAVMDGLEREGPKDVQEKAGLLGCSLSRKRPFPEDVLKCWVPEESRREQRVDGLSTTDCALQEEAKRYALPSYTKGNQAMGTPFLLSSNFDQAPEGESFDRSGELEEELGGDKSTWLTVYEGSVDASGIQASENVKGELWEECSLAKFSQVLGFSTEGIEKEIVNFLTRIRKRREKIHSKELLEKTKFERELKRLECSVNYEGGNKQKALSQGKGNQLIVVQ